MSTGEKSTPWIRAANFALLWFVSLAFAVGMLRSALDFGTFGQDTHAYWLTGHDAELYDAPPRYVDAYLYSPAFAAVIKPLTLLPFPAFYAVWTAGNVALLAWLVRPLPTRWAVPAALLSVPELVFGNIYLMLGAMVALGFRHPAAWSFGVLTKITPGVGVLWFVVRGEWRRAAWAALATVAIVGVSFALTPRAWVEWFAFLLSNSGEGGDGAIGLVTRCALAIAVVVVAARSNRVWLVPFAVLLANPVLIGAWAPLMILLAIPRLVVATEPSEPVLLRGGGRDDATSRPRPERVGSGELA